MGCGLVTGDRNPPDGGRVTSTPISYAKVFEQQLPYYLAFGMTWNDFWHGDPDMYVAFREAHRIRKIQKNQELWLQGMYIYEALGDMAPVLRMSLGGGPTKPIPYSEQPYPIDEREVAERKAEEDRKQLEKLAAQFEALAVGINQNFESEEVSADE